MEQACAICGIGLSKHTYGFSHSFKRPPNKVVADLKYDIDYHVQRCQQYLNEAQKISVDAPNVIDHIQRALQEATMALTLKMTLSKIEGQ